MFILERIKIKSHLSGTCELPTVFFNVVILQVHVPALSKFTCLVVFVVNNLRKICIFLKFSKRKSPPPLEILTENGRYQTHTTSWLHHYVLVKKQYICVTVNIFDFLTKSQVTGSLCLPEALRLCAAAHSWMQHEPTLGGPVLLVGLTVHVFRTSCRTLFAFQNF